MDENWVQIKTKLYSRQLSHDTHEGFTTGPTLRYHRHTDITAGEANESAGRLGQMLDPLPQGQKNATHFQPVDMLGFLPTAMEDMFPAPPASTCRLTWESFRVHHRSSANPNIASSMIYPG